MLYAPSDPSKRYDDKGYSIRYSDCFHPQPSQARSGQVRVGYPIHLRCWQLLSHCTRTRYEGLFLLLQSTIDGMLFRWLGDYGGLFNSMYYPSSWPFSMVLV